MAINPYESPRHYITKESGQQYHDPADAITWIICGVCISIALVWGCVVIIASS
jgi:hypothetical protein